MNKYCCSLKWSKQTPDFGLGHVLGFLSHINAVEVRKSVLLLFNKIVLCQEQGKLDGLDPQSCPFSFWGNKEKLRLLARYSKRPNR
jgi:hypothetical protein